MALRLFLHAFQTIFRNWKEAFTISIIPLGLLVVVTLLFGTNFSGDVSQVGGAAALGLGAFVLFFAFVFTFAFIAASWHRFVLLEETPKFLGSPAIGRTLPYIGNSILLGLWLLLFLLPIMLVVGFIFAAVAGDSFNIRTAALNTALTYDWKDILYEIITGAITGTIAFMYSLILPASAINQSMTFRASRLAAMKLGVELFLLALLVATFNTLANYVVFIIFGGATGILSSLISLAIQWLVLMVGISILTTLYGHLVEGRDLPA